MIKAIIVDDEQPAIDVLKLLLTEDGRIDILGTFRKPKEVIIQIADLQPDVVFIDVQMPLMNGLELAEQLLEIHEGLEIVFVTAYEHYAVEAFKLNAIDYLMKPLNPVQIKRTVDRLSKMRGLLRLKETQSEKPQSKARILCFNGFQVQSSPTEAMQIKWRTSKSEELFAYFYCHRDAAITKWEIIEAIWPDCNDEQAHSHLHTTLYKMKKTLKEAQIEVKISFFRGSYRMELEGISSDLEEFLPAILDNALLNEQGAAEYQRTLALFTGDLFGELDYSWSMEIKERYRSSFVTLSKKLAVYLLETQQYQQAEQYIQRLLKMAGLDEEGGMLLLECYFLQNDRVALIRSYERLVYLLNLELGIEPTASLKRSYERMLREI